MSTLTCVFGDGSSIDYNRDQLLSCSSFVASMMAETEETTVPLPLIPSKGRFIKMMSMSKRMGTPTLVTAANDANYIGHTEALDFYIERLARVLESRGRTEIHQVVDNLIPDVLNCVLREVHACNFFVNVGMKKMIESPQLHYVAENAQLFVRDYPIYDKVFRGMERFDKFDLSKPKEGDEAMLKYLMCCTKDHNVEAVKELSSFISEDSRRIPWIGHAASWFGCVDIVELCLDMGRYGFHTSFAHSAVRAEQMDVIDYIVGNNRLSLSCVMGHALAYKNIRLLDIFVQRWKDLGFPLEIESTNDYLSKYLVRKYGFIDVA